MANKNYWISEFPSSIKTWPEALRVLVRQNDIKRRSAAYHCDDRTFGYNNIVKSATARAAQLRRNSEENLSPHLEVATNS